MKANFNTQSMVSSDAIAHFGREPHEILRMVSGLLGFPAPILLYLFI